MDDNPYQAPQSRLDAQRDRAADDDEDTVERLPHHEYDPTGMRFAEASRRSGVRIDALRFVFDAHVNASDIAQDTPQGRMYGLGLSEAVVLYAEEIYGTEALKALADWDLAKGSDVRRVWDALVANGLKDPTAEPDEQQWFDTVPLSRFAQISR